MGSNIAFESIGEKHIASAISMVMSGYHEERQAVPCLPQDHEMMDDLHQLISRLFSKGSGIAAIKDDKLIGFLAGYEVKELFGKNKGIYCPLYGHGAVKEHRSRLYQELYKQAADLWMKRSITSHALTIFAHDSNTIDTWFWLGFGHRCVDSIRQTNPIGTNPSTLVVKKLGQEELRCLAELQNGLLKHLRSTPMFMYKQEEDPIEFLSDWIKEENHHIWAACYNGKAVGFMSIQPAAESFVSEHPSIMNITGAYVSESQRNSGAATLLLDTVLDWLSAEGYPFCGVDFEAFNVEGSRFWNKYFVPYTYSLVRRLDERMI